MRRTFVLLVIGCCSVGFAGCGDGGDSDLTFEDMCDQGAIAMCRKASSCGSTQATDECIAEAKTLKCPGGVEQYCGVGMTFQSNKAPACLDALESLACLALAEIPTACTPEVLCVSQGGTTPGATPGEACHAVGNPDGCDPKASLCYAAGISSSCPSKGLCVGDGTGMTCAARCTLDADCLSAGTGLICMQSCTVAIINGFCITPKAKAKLMQHTCSDTKYSSTSGTSGWAM